MLGAAAHEAECQWGAPRTRCAYLRAGIAPPHRTSHRRFGVALDRCAFPLRDE
jgi:hypothetical protein